MGKRLTELEILDTLEDLNQAVAVLDAERDELDEELNNEIDNIGDEADDRITDLIAQRDEDMNEAEKSYESLYKDIDRQLASLAGRISRYTTLLKKRTSKVKAKKR